MPSAPIAGDPLTQCEVAAVCTHMSEGDRWGPRKGDWPVRRGLQPVCAHAGNGAGEGAGEIVLLLLLDAVPDSVKIGLCAAADTRIIHTRVSATRTMSYATAGHVLLTLRTSYANSQRANLQR